MPRPAVRRVRRPSSLHRPARPVRGHGAALLCLFVALACGLVSRPATAARPEPALEAALAELAEGRADEGRARLEAAVRRDPQPEALCLLGRVLAHQGRPRDALETFARVPASAPCARQAAFGRADALLALGRADEAATLYRTLGTPAFGPDRDAGTAAAIVGLADRVLADPDGDRGQAVALLELAAGLRVAPETRLRLAQRIADLVTAPPPDAVARPTSLTAARRDDGSPQPASAADAARRILLRHLAAPAGHGPGDRLRFARLAQPFEGLAALSAMSAAADPETARAARLLRTSLLARSDLDAGLFATESLGASALDEPAIAAHAERLLREHRRSRALPWLSLLARGDGPLAADALLRSAELAAAGPGGGDAPAAYRALVERFPTHPHARTAAASLEAHRLAEARGAFAAGDLARALAAYDALVAAHPHGETASWAAYEAGVVARALNPRGEDAPRRWRAVALQFTATRAAEAAQVALARHLAFDLQRPEEGLELLRTVARRPEFATAAGAERERWKTSDLALESPARQSPERPVKVRVVSRNVTELEMRLHRVEAEPYLRAGGTPEGLAELDVAAIAPDRRWKVTLPAGPPGETLAREIDVPVPGPGFFVVTASGGDLEASAVVLVSSLDLVVRTVGPDLVAAVFRGGRPVGGATLMLRVDQTVTRVRTGADGLYRGPVGGGALAVLALDDDEPALLALSRGTETAPEPPIELGLDLDRPAYRSRDTVAFRLAVRRGGRPVAGPWRVALDGPGGELPARSLVPGPSGSVSGELPLPALVEPGEALVWQVVVRLPGEQTARVAGSLRQLPERPDERRLVVAMDTPPRLGATVSLSEPDGLPAVGVPVVFSSGDEGGDDASVGRGVTDATGRVEIPGPAAGLPFSVVVRVPGSGLTASATRPWPVAFAPALRLVPTEDRLRPGERPVARLTGTPGPVRVVLVRRVPLRETPGSQAPGDPYVPTVSTELRGPLTWSGFGPTALAAGLEDEIWHVDLNLPEGPEPAPLSVEPPPVPAGDYALRATALDGRVESVTVFLNATADGLRLRGARDAGLGERLPLTLEGGPALVTAEGDRLFAARVLQPGQSFELPVEAGFPAQLTLVATGAAPNDVSTDTPHAVARRVHARTVHVDTALRVTVTATAGQGLLSAEARVLDGAGRPVSAEVVLAAVDTDLVHSVGAPAQVGHTLFRNPVVGIAPVGGVADRFAHGAAGEEVSAAVRAEEARANEAARAAAAAEGRFERNALADKLGEAVPLAEGGTGLGGLGAIGHGSGAGGRGYGRGRMVQAASIVGCCRPPAAARDPLAGDRHRADRRGPRPRRDLRAAAGHAEAAGGPARDRLAHRRAPSGRDRPQPLGGAPRRDLAVGRKPAARLRGPGGSDDGRPRRADPGCPRGRRPAGGGAGAGDRAVRRAPGRRTPPGGRAGGDGGGRARGGAPTGSPGARGGQPGRTGRPAGGAGGARADGGPGDGRTGRANAGARRARPGAGRAADPAAGRARRRGRGPALPGRRSRAAGGSEGRARGGGSTGRRHAARGRDGGGACVRALGAGARRVAGGRGRAGDGARRGGDPLRRRSRIPRADVGRRVPEGPRDRAGPRAGLGAERNARAPPPRDAPRGTRRRHRPARNGRCGVARLDRGACVAYAPEPATDRAGRRSTRRAAPGRTRPRHRGPPPVRAAGGRHGRGRRRRRRAQCPDLAGRARAHRPIRCADAGTAGAEGSRGIAGLRGRHAGGAGERATGRPVRHRPEPVPRRCGRTARPRRRRGRPPGDRARRVDAPLGHDRIARAPACRESRPVPDRGAAAHDARG
ncbi:hypothetical protein L6V77_13395 [Myxococcota bacterium]|nr:hypothetical protein [Myxococcota bacterium]